LWSDERSGDTGRAPKTGRDQEDTQVARTATPKAAPRRAARTTKVEQKDPAPAKRKAAPPRAGRAAKPKVAAADRTSSFVSKEALRAQLEKTEQQVVTLRKKNRELTRAARDATSRIGELEEQLDALQKRAARDAKRPSGEAARPPRQRRSRPERDPGDAVPEGVAVAEPQPMDREAEQALENLERHLQN